MRPSSGRLIVLATGDLEPGSMRKDYTEPNGGTAMRVIDEFRISRWAPALAVIFLTVPSLSHATFSIVAVDTVT